MKVRRINESAEFNFNSAVSSGNWPYKMSIETYVDIRDEISQIIDNLDQSCVFAIARDATNLGPNIDKERLYYSPIVTIENNISPEKINQFRSIVMKYSDKQLNEDYLDSAEYRIQRYEDDIPELMAGMHNDYMEGKLDAARYAEVLKKVYDALSEFNYKNTMISPKTDAGKRVLDALDKLDEEVDAYNPLDKDDEDDDEYSDDYIESLDKCSGIRAHKVIMGEDLDNSFDDIDGVEGPTGDKTEDIEFVMEEYIAKSLLIDFVEKVDALTYKVGVNDQIVTVVFDPKWSEYVYTINGKGPYSHSSYEYISRDVYDFVMSQRTGDEYDDDFDDLSSFNECSDVKRADVLYGVERNESLTESKIY